MPDHFPKIGIALVIVLAIAIDMAAYIVSPRLRARSSILTSVVTLESRHD